MGYWDNSPTIQATGAIMVTAIIVVFLVVVFILFLRLYARWFWWHIEERNPPPPASGPRRRRRRPLVFSPGQEVPHRTGLDLAVLRSLPAVIFQAKDYKEEGLECAVCLCEVEEGEKARFLPKCNHGFHVDCIDMWFQSHSTCPICRSKVAPLLPPPNGGPNSDDHNRDGLEEGTGQPLEEISASGYSSESASFPTNVLVWGDLNQVSTNGGGNGCLELGEGTSGQFDSRNSFAASSSNLDAVLVVDIPEQVGEILDEGESNKSPVPPRRLRSFRRLLSWERRVAPSCPSSSDEV